MLVLGLAVRSFAAGNLGSVGGGEPPRVVPVQLDLNRAGTEELQALPGVGGTRAEAIVLHRVRHGPFRSILELDQVDGIGVSTIAGLRAFLTVGGAALQAAPR